MKSRIIQLEIPEGGYIEEKMVEAIAVLTNIAGAMQVPCELYSGKRFEVVKKLKKFRLTADYYGVPKGAIAREIKNPEHPDKKYVITGVMPTDIYVGESFIEKEELFERIYE